MLPKIIYSLIVLTLSNLLQAQKEKTHFLQKIIIGTNYTYVPDTEVFNGIDNKTFYHENTIATNIAVDIKKHFRIGIDYKNIQTNGQVTGRNKYNMLGLFTQYKFAETKKGFGFGELGYYKGNYCTCGKDIPYKLKGINYLNWGGGFNFLVYKNIRMDLAFTTAQVLNKVTEPYGYTQYVIGIDYVIPVISK
jgi:hypothetical protein